MKTLYVIDGFAVMFRAYYAIGSRMTSPINGQPTNASFGFTSMLMKLLQQSKPDQIVMAVECEGKTFRHELYPQYKGTRSAPPDDFLPQIPDMMRMAELLGIPILKADTFEADDILASIATQYAQQDPELHIRLVASDKDLEQVLSERTALYDAQKDTLTTPESLLAKKGITPAQVIDYQSLCGDSSDNIPGVHGIGPKSAQKLLETYGTLENLVANASDIKGKMGERLRTAIEDGTLALSTALVTLSTDVPLPYSAETMPDWTLERIHTEDILQFMRELGFNRLRDDLQHWLGAPAAPEPTRAEPAAFGLFAQSSASTPSANHAHNPRDTEKGNYRTLTTADDITHCIQAIEKIGHCAIDTETDGLGMYANVVGISLSWQEGQGVYIPIDCPEQAQCVPAAAALAMLKPLIENPAIGKYGHHIKFDWHILKTAGITLRGIMGDSMIAGGLLAKPGLKMDDLALAELGWHCTPIHDLIGPPQRRKSDPAQKTFNQIPLAHAGAYAAEDADITLRLCNTLLAQLTAQSEQSAQLYLNIEVPLIEVLAQCERYGVALDAGKLQSLGDSLSAQQKQLQQDILDAAGFDFSLDSPKQVADALYNQLGFKILKKGKTGPSTHADILHRHVNGEGIPLLATEAQKNIPQQLLHYREVTKLIQTYVNGLQQSQQADGRVRGRYNQLGASTGRLSSSEPNLQNIPIRSANGKAIRACFIAADNHKLISADYSQIELRILAHLSDDANLKQAFKDGIDIHKAVASQVFATPLADVTDAQRSRAKAINFGIVYGITAFGLASRVEELTNQQAAELIKEYKTHYPGITTYLDTCIDYAKKHGNIQTMLGRVRPIDGFNSRHAHQRQLAERLAINTAVQGSAADLIKKAMNELKSKLDQTFPDAHMLLQVHDELVVEAPTSQAQAVAQLMQTTMQNTITLNVPLRVDIGIGDNWLDCK